jgi:hypothetical protein
MGVEFNVNRVALHFVDTDSDGPRLSTNEINVQSLGQNDDIKIPSDFFKGHLEKIWLDKESKKTCAEKLYENQGVEEIFKRAKELPGPMNSSYGRFRHPRARARPPGDGARAALRRWQAR